MRTFEMPALGCIMLAPRSKEHLMFFKEGKEAFFYDSEEELIEKCNYVLNLNATEINAIRQDAYQRSINSGYSYKDRANLAFEKINALISK